MNLLKTEIAFPPELMDTVFMRLGFIILPGVLLTLSACGRGGATLETDNVQAEWFPKGSRTAIILENETEPGADKAARNAPAALTLLYTSHGDGQGVLISATFHFKTPSREISLHEVRRSSADGNAARLSGWTYQEQPGAVPRTGAAGSLAITDNSPR